MPQVLERCLHEVYADFGWDTVTGRNRRLNGDEPAHMRNLAMPRLSDLYAKVAVIVGQLGYDDKVASDIKAALLTRLNSLRIGGKGAMLDTTQEVPIDQLLRFPTIIELDAIGDDDEKAFLMGLLLVRIVEHLRTFGIQQKDELRHIIVVEEAHRLLANVSSHGDQEQANVRGKAVEMFANMLSEVRAYGESFIIADQVPTKLAPDVIKNTNVKIAHRIVSGDDREVLGMAMNMSEQQRDYLATLTVGQAALFAEGDDRPVLIKVPLAKLGHEEVASHADSEMVVATQMKRIRLHWQDPEQIVPFYPEAKAAWCHEWQQLGQLFDEPIVQRAFAKLMLSTTLVEQPERVSVMISAFLVLVRRFLPIGFNSSSADRGVILQGVHWYVTYYGATYRWPYAATWELMTLAASLLLKAMGDGLEVTNALYRFQQAYQEAVRHPGNLSACEAICAARGCYFRFHSTQLTGDYRLSAPFEEALGLAGEMGFWGDSIALPLASEELLDSTVEESWQKAAANCYGQQKILAHSQLLESRKSSAISVMLDADELQVAIEMQ